MANKRKKQLIHRDIQLTLVKRLLFQWFVFVVATGLVTVIVQYLFDPLQPAKDAALRIQATIGSMLIVSLCLAPVFIRDSIKLSHRVVGPIHRLRMGLQNVDPNGQNTRIRLRKADFFKEVAHDYNEMLDRVESRETIQS